MKGLVTNGTDTTLMHETPPNSTESYTLYGEVLQKTLIFLEIN